MGNQLGLSTANPMTSQPMGMSNPNMMSTSIAMSQPQQVFPGVSQGESICVPWFTAVYLISALGILVT